MGPGERQTERAEVPVRNNALYFPYVDVPHNDWFARVLLYWDKVGSIVPSGYLREPDRLDPRMRELVTAGVVEQVMPMDHAEDIERLPEHFLAYVREKLEAVGRQPRGRAAAYRSGRTLLHLEKMGPTANELVGLGIARPADFQWYEVETWAANAYMFFLTSMLGALPEVGAVPVTNEGGARAFLSGGFSRRRGANDVDERRALAARGRMLEALLPAPLHPPDVLELLRFKEQHGHLLRAFRREIELKSIEIANIKSPTLRARYARLKIDGLEEQIDKISGAMGRRWENVSFGKLLPILSSGIGTASYAAGLPETVAGIGTGVSLLVAVRNALRNKGPDYGALSDNPMAYVAHARDAFGWRGRPTRA